MKKIVILIFALFIVIAAYSNSLSNSFVWDDFLVVVDNNFIKSWNNLPLVFSGAYLSPYTGSGYVNTSIGSGETSYRPVATLSYFMDYSLWKLNPFGYHLTNLILHIFCALLVYLLGELLIKSRAAALLASLLFALHPVNSEAVNVIAFREDLLTGLFYLLSFFLYLKSSRQEPGKGFWFYIFSLVSFFLALFSKETAVTLLLLVVLYDCYFLGGRREIIARFHKRYAGYLAVLLFYVWVRFTWIVNVNEPDLGYLGGNFYTNFLTMVRVVATYIGWLVFPVGISPIPSSQPYLVSSSLFAPAVLFSFVLLTAFFAMIARIYKVSKEASFFMLWFFLALLPVSNIIPIANHIASRYLYLSAAGFCLLTAILIGRITFPKFVSGSLAAALVASYAGMTFLGNFAWQNDLVLYSDMAERFPGNALVRLDLGDAYKRYGLLQKAVSEYEAAIFLDPGLVEAYAHMGATLGDMGDDDEAVNYFLKGLQVAPDSLELYDNLAVAYARNKDWTDARKTWERILEIDPHYKTAIENLQKLKELGYGAEGGS